MTVCNRVILFLLVSLIVMGTGPIPHAAVDSEGHRTFPTSFKITNPQSFQESHGLQFRLVDQNRMKEELQRMKSAIPTMKEEDQFFGVGEDCGDRTYRNDYFHSVFYGTSGFLKSNTRTSSQFGYLVGYMVYNEKNEYVGMIIPRFLRGMILRHVKALIPEDSKEKYQLDRSQLMVNISVAVHPSFRQKGYGKRMVQGLMNILKKETSVSDVIYYGMPENEASISLAQSLGFTEVESWDDEKRIFISTIKR